MTTFNDLGLAAPILKALEEEGYTTPTPIQAQSIPSLLAGKDLLGIAQTGTGKTAAFALPILTRLAADPKPAPRRGCRVLVLSPTRELASQIAESFETYGKHMKLKVAVVFGGVGYRPQTDALARGLDVLVATPGRLLDHIGGRTADLRDTEVLVLDEADQMLDLGFIRPIRQIVSGMSAARQNLLFSATMPREISGLADQLLTNPVKVAVTPVSSTVERVAQRVIHVDQNRKRALLAELMTDEAVKLALVFTRTKRGADRVARHLETHGVTVAAIHGNKSQRQREIALDDFRAGKIRVLVATDIAARGIDVEQVSHVVNFELPEVPEAYVHRIGRTARAGASGIAVSLCSGEERDLLRAIERLTRQTLPSEDRRNDRTLATDAPPARGERDDRDDRSNRGRRPQRDQGEGRGQRSREATGGPSRHRGERVARPEGGRPQRNGSGSRSSDAGQSQGSGRGSGETTASLSNVGFLARSGSGERSGGGGHHRGPASNGGSGSRNAGGSRQGERRSDDAGGGNRKRSRRGGAGRPNANRETAPAS